MSRQSIQKIKAMLLCIEYGILFVDTVDTKIKAYNALNAMFVDTFDTGVCGLSRKSSIRDERDERNPSEWNVDTVDMKKEGLSGI